MPHKTAPLSASQQRNATAARVRRLLTGATLPRDDSDDELGEEDHPWKWVYEANNTSDEGQDQSGHDASQEDDEKEITTKKTRRNKLVRNISTSSNHHIVGARMGSFACKIGDCVLLKADGNQAWVGMICEFCENENEEMSANIMCT